MTQKYVMDLVSALEVPPGGSVLDVGCGDGSLTIQVKTQLPDTARMSALDRRKLKKTSQLLEAGIAFTKGFMHKLPFCESEFDVVYANMAFHDLFNPEEPGQAVNEMIRVARPGGRVVVADVDCRVCFELVERPQRDPGVLGPDFFVGRKLPRLLQEASAIDAGGRVSVELDLSGAEPRTWSYHSTCSMVIAWGHKPG